MALPFFTATIATYPVFLIMFHGWSHIPDSIDAHRKESAAELSTVLDDKLGATFGSTLLTAKLVVLVSTVTNVTPSGVRAC